MTDRLDELLAAAAVEHLGEDAGLGSITAWVNLHKAAPDLLEACQDALQIQAFAAEAALPGPTAEGAWREVEAIVADIRAAIDKACSL